MKKEEEKGGEGVGVRTDGKRGGDRRKRTIKEKVRRRKE